MKTTKKRRGGYRERTVLLKSTSRLIEYLIKTVGTPMDCYEATGIPAQIFIDSKLRGKIPVKHLPKVCSLFSVSPLLLNYEATYPVLAAFAMVGDLDEIDLKWKPLIDSYKGAISEADREYILNGVHPDA